MLSTQKVTHASPQKHVLKWCWRF